MQLPNLFLKELRYGKNREAHDIFKSALILFGMIGFIGSAFLWLGSSHIANMMGIPEAKGIMIALSPAIFLASVAAVIRGYFNGMYNMKVSSFAQIVEQFFKSVLTVLLVLLVYHITIVTPGTVSERLGLSENNVTVAMAITANAASTIAAGIGLFYVLLYYQKSKKGIWEKIHHSVGTYNKEKKTRIMKRILAVSIPISLASIVSAINRNIDTFTVVNQLKIGLLGTFSMNQAAVLEEAKRLYGILSGRVDTLIGLPAALNVAFSTALVPVVSEAVASNDMKTAVRRITFSIRTSLLIALPCAIGMCVLAGPILKLLFPSLEVGEASLLLQISSFTIIFTLLNQTIAGALQGLGKVLVPALSLACGAILKLILNITLIKNPSIGIYGAAISSVVASLLATMIELYVLRKKIKFDSKLFHMFVKPVFAVSIMGVVTFYFHHFFTAYIHGGKIATILAIAVGVVVYVIAILALRIFRKEDYNMLPYGNKIVNILEKMKVL